MGRYLVELMGYNANRFTAVVLFLQAMVYVGEDLPGRCVGHELRCAKDRSRGTNEEAPVLSMWG